MKKPSIIIKYNENIKEKTLKEIVAGIEEEGVLYTLIPEKEVNPFILSMNAVAMSPVEVGIGISDEKAILSVKKMVDKPLFYTDEQYRNIGHNAARYVKGRPFIPMKNKLKEGGY